jgi:8-oxo-dGTP pyrophosphatase MutT (NUDIX family)
MSSYFDAMNDADLQTPIYTGHPSPIHKPWRKRAEMYAISGGMVFGGLYEGGNFGGFGGGQEPGETLVRTAEREFMEETAYAVEWIMPIPVEPFQRLWLEVHGHERKEYCGSETHYFFGHLGVRLTGQLPDELGRRKVGLYTLDEAIRLCVVPGLDELRMEANAKRKEVLEFLRKLHVMFTL